MDKITLKKEYLNYGIIALILIFPSFFFGFTGFTTFLGFFVVLVFPAYLFLGLANIDNMERVLLSVFLGIIIGALLLWYLDRIFSSLKLSIGISAILFYSLALFLLYIRKKNQKAS